MMKGTFRSAADAAKTTISADWGSLNWVANEEYTGNQGITLGRVVIRKGQKNARHRHNSCEEVLFLLRGRLRHTVGDDEIVMEAGDTIAIPAGVFHNGINIGDEDADMIVAYSTGKRDFELEDAKGSK